jgi:uncharacterized protein (TIGR03084 family)
MRQAIADLRAEHADLDGILVGLDEAGWDLPTPSAPWTIRDQVAHLAYFDEKAALAARDPDGFRTHLEADLDDGMDAIVARHLATGRGMAPAEVLDWWRAARETCAEALAAVDPDLRIPWYGPPMRASSSVVARLMETWAQGQDVVDALAIDRHPTDRLFHLAELGVRTFRFSFENRGLEAPTARVRVALRGATGNVRVWNDDADASITGPLLDFCLVVTQRRHISDTHLVTEGGLARHWMEVAQVFAGPPGPGREPAAPWVPR